MMMTDVSIIMQVLRKYLDVYMLLPSYCNKNYNFLGINCVVTETLGHYSYQYKYCVS
jgi:hypothetical protein